MSAYTDRRGQRIGGWTIEDDAGRTKHGKVLWRLRHHDGRVKHLTTCKVIRLDRQHVEGVSR